MKTRVTFHKHKVMARHKSSLQQAQYAIDNQILKDTNDGYVPRDKGTLVQSSITHSKIGKGVLIWRTKYAKRLYYNPQYNFSTDRNLNAQGLWFEGAKATRLPSWLLVAKRSFGSTFGGG